MSPYSFNTIIHNADHYSSACIALDPGRDHIEVHSRAASTLTHVVLREKMITSSVVL